MHIPLAIAIFAVLAFALLQVLDHLADSGIVATDLRAHLVRIAALDAGVSYVIPTPIGAKACSRSCSEGGPLNSGRRAGAEGADSADA